MWLRKYSREASGAGVSRCGKWKQMRAELERGGGEGEERPWLLLVF